MDAASYLRVWKSTVYTSAFVVDFVLKEHNISVYEWLQAVLRSASGNKVKLLPHFIDYAALNLSEEDVELLRKKSGGGCLEFAAQCFRAIAAQSPSRSFEIWGTPQSASHYGAWEPTTKVLVDSLARKLIVIRTSPVVAGTTRYSLSAFRPPFPFIVTSRHDYGPN